MWGKVSCLSKQHNGREWASNHRSSDLKSNALTTTPLHLDVALMYIYEVYLTFYFALLTRLTEGFQLL